MIITFEQHLDSCSHHKQYAFSLGVSNACEVEKNQCKNHMEKVAENIKFPTVVCTYCLVATVFGSNFLNQKDIYSSKYVLD